MRTCRSRPVALLLVALCAFGRSAAGQGSNYRALEQITINNTAGGVGFTSSAITPAGGPQATVATCTLETADIRYTIDDTAPTSSVGMYWTSGSTLTFSGGDVLRAFRAIRATGSNGKLDCTYSVPILPAGGPINGAGGGGGGGGGGVVTQSTGTNLHMVCDAGCSSSTAPADEGTFTAGSTSHSPVGGFFQTAPTTNALTDGQMGAFQITAQRALFSNLRNASGTEVGTSTTPLQVTLANTGANATAVKVDGSAVTQPVSLASVPSHAVTNAGTFATQATLATGSAQIGHLEANQSVNIAQLAGSTLVADPCAVNAKSYLAISQTANTKLITGTSAKKIYLCSLALVGADAENLSIVEGTGTVCATSTAAVIGGATAAAGMNFAANGGYAQGNGASAFAAEATNADDLCLFQSGSGRVAGNLSYVVQ